MPMPHSSVLPPSLRPSPPCCRPEVPRLQRLQRLLLQASRISSSDLRPESSLSTPATDERHRASRLPRTLSTRTPGRSRTFAESEGSLIEPQVRRTIDPRETYTIHFDGSSRGHPQRGRIQSGAGAAILDPSGNLLCTVTEGSRGATCSEAEYLGLIAGLAVARALGIRKVSVHGDSELVVLQVRGTSRVKRNRLIPLASEALRIVGFFEEFSIRHVPREQNVVADGLAVRGLALTSGQRLLGLGNSTFDWKASFEAFLTSFQVQQEDE